MPLPLPLPLIRNTSTSADMAVMAGPARRGRYCAAGKDCNCTKHVRKNPPPAGDFSAAGVTIISRIFDIFKIILTPRHARGPRRAHRQATNPKNTRNCHNMGSLCTPARVFSWIMHSNLKKEVIIVATDWRGPCQPVKMVWTRNS